MSERIPIDQLIKALDVAITPNMKPTPAVAGTVEPSEATRVQPTRTANEKNDKDNKYEIKIVAVLVRCLVVFDFIYLTTDSDD